MSHKTAAVGAAGADLERLRSAHDEIRRELARRIVGQEEVIRELLIALLVEGHALIIGVPGLAKTLLIRSLAELLSLEFRRIQFTPDLMPSDITGTSLIFEDDGVSGERGFRFLPGPIFANIILADEINRTPPKTQAALMEAMEEHQVTVAAKRHVLERPFFVLATQNPIEQEGTYPLPVSQLDRFLFSIQIDYPEADEEFEIVARTTGVDAEPLPQVLEADEVRALIARVRAMRIPDPLTHYAAGIVRATRPQDPAAPEFVREWLQWGAGVRGVQALILGAKAQAALAGRQEVIPDDIHSVALPALRHRVLRNYHAEAEEISPDRIITQVLATRPEGHYAPPETKADPWWSRLFRRRSTVLSAP